MSATTLHIVVPELFGLFILNRKIDPTMLNNNNNVTTLSLNSSPFLEPKCMKTAVSGIKIDIKKTVHDFLGISYLLILLVCFLSSKTFL